MVRPVCSVIVAVYNGAAFLPQCLDSLMAQTLDGVEVIVADDASTDATPEVLAMPPTMTLSAPCALTKTTARPMPATRR